MAVIREGGTDPGSQRGRKGGTKGTYQLLILPIQFIIVHDFNFVAVVHVVFVCHSGGFMSAQLVGTRLYSVAKRLLELRTTVEYSL